MRILIDLPQEDVEAFDQLSATERRSRAAIIRGVLSDYLKDSEEARRRATMEAVFGLWKDRGIDGLEYQERIRAEWERDPIP